MPAWIAQGLSQDDRRMLDQIAEIDWQAIPVSEQLERVREWVRIERKPSLVIPQRKGKHGTQK